MKSKRYLAALLSVVMLISSLSVWVIADGNEGDADDPVAGDTSKSNIDALTEGEYYIKDNVPYHSTLSVTFTPETTGKYSFMANNTSDPSITVTDEHGTALPFVNSDIASWSAMVTLQLEAGKTYTFNVSASMFGFRKPCTFLVMKTPEHAKEGQNRFLTRSNSGNRVSFTPSVGGAYVISVSADNLVENEPTIYGSIYEGDKEVYTNISTSTQNRYFAYFEANKTYTVKFTCYDESDAFYCVANVDISRDIPALTENVSNSVTLGSDSDVPLYSFTPMTDGVYVFSSESEYSTEVMILDRYGNNISEYEYGGDSNFRIGVCMKAAETYYVKLQTWDDGKITFPVSIVKAEYSQSGEYEVAVGRSEIAYRAFTPEVSGSYLIANSTRGNVRIGSYLDSNFRKGNINVCNLEKDQLYAIGYVNSGSEDHITYVIKLIDETLMAGSSTTLSKQVNNHMYARFVPSETGTYTFSITMPEGKDYNYAGVYYASTGYSASQVAYDYSSKQYTYYLEAGVPYIFDLNEEYFDNPAERVTVSVTKEALPTLSLGKNKDLFTGSDKTYTFTPETTGIYVFYNFTSTSLNLYSGSECLSYYMMDTDYEEDYYSYAFALKAGQQYRLSVDPYISGPKDLYITAAPALEVSENKVEKYGNIVYASFTPSKSGVYYFSCEDGSISSVCKVTDERIEGLTTNSTNGKCSAILEAGKTYVLKTSAKSSHSSDSFIVTVSSERILNMGENEDIFVERNSGSNTRFTYYSFVPTKSGTYTLRTENHDGFSVSGLLYKDNDLSTEIGRGYSSYDTGEMTMTVTLEAGVLYRLGLYTNQDEQDLDVDLFIEVAPAGKLGGYSLSLDGSIAVNLYLTIADYVTTSSTAVLRCTFPNRPIVDYKITDATVKTMNNQTYYVFRLPVAAKEMRDTIYAQIIDEANGIQSEKYGVSVMEYAGAVITNAYDSYGNIANQEFYDAIPMVKALLNYGSRAQTYFNHSPYRLANEILDRTDRNLSSVSYQSIPQYDSSRDAKLPTGLTFYGASLAIESETKLTFYFINNTGKTVTYSEATNKISNYSGKTSGGYTTVSVSGIAAHKLGDKIRVNITVDGDDQEYYVEYSPLNYCYNVLRGDLTETRTAELKNLMQAFYIYNQAAVNYKEYHQN